MSIEAMKLALEALEDINSLLTTMTGASFTKLEHAATALRQAIEQAQKQEPDKYVMDIECTNCGTKQSGILTVNTTTPQREPLSEEQIEAISAEIERSDFFDCVIPFARAIEAAHGIKGEAT